MYLFQVSIIKISHFKHHKLTYTGLLLNFKSFTSFSYKISLIKCLIDRSFKICNNWKSFQKNIENIKSSLVKNVYPPFLINKAVKKYVGCKYSSSEKQLKDKSDVYYFRLRVVCFAALWDNVLKSQAKNFHPFPYIPILKIFNNF